MIKDILAQLSLGEMLNAKIERRLMLLAEVHSLEQELAAAGMLLAELHSVRIAQDVALARRDLPALAIVSGPGCGNRTNHEVSRRVASLKNERRDCACGAMFMVHRKSVRTECDACLSTKRRGFIERARAARSCWKVVNE